MYTYNKAYNTHRNPYKTQEEDTSAPNNEIIY